MAGERLLVGARSVVTDPSVPVMMTHPVPGAPVADSSAPAVDHAMCDRAGVRFIHLHQSSQSIRAALALMACFIGGESAIAPTVIDRADAAILFGRLVSAPKSVIQRLRCAVCGIRGGEIGIAHAGGATQGVKDCVHGCRAVGKHMLVQISATKTVKEVGG